MHIPEAYGDEGGDALATVIVIEEVARVCASSLIPAVNKLVSCVVLGGLTSTVRRPCTVHCMMPPNH